MTSGLGLDRLTWCGGRRSMSCDGVWAELEVLSRCVRHWLADCSFGVSGAAAQVPVSYDGVDVSNDGSIVAFATTAALVSPDGNGRSDVYVLDRRNGNLTLASVSVNGRSGNAASRAPSLSPDGGWVAFESNASNLVSGDGNGLSDVFLRDLNSRATVKVSGGAGPAANGDSRHPDVSAARPICRLRLGRHQPDRS